MAFMVNTDGTILADTAADAVALSELLRGRTAPAAIAAPLKREPEPDEPIPFTVTAKPRPVKLAAPKVEGGKRRPLGTGSVYSPNQGKAWAWSIGPRGDRTVKRGFATRAEAEASLDAHLSGNSAPVVPPAAPSVRSVPSVKTRGEWSDAENGLQKHLVCNGSGKVDDPDKTRGKTRCHGCKGEGFRRAS